MSLFALDAPLDASICGEKAARLSQLKREGFTVPDGWVVSADTSDLDTVARALTPSRDRPYIVRSSAIGEDGDTSSAAGQYLSVGPVETPSALIEAIQACRESYQSENAIAYRRQRQLPDTAMAVLVQPYKQASVAGVAFSRHPLDGAPFTAIEALPQAAAVVGGRQTPEHLEIPKAAATSSEIQQSDLLPANVLSLLVEQVARVEALFHGIPQDVEWVWDGDRLWIVQSRPISNLRPIWTRTIAAEVIPGAIHPLTWSINRPLTCGVWGDIYTVVLAERACGLDFSNTATLFGSHAYFNATLLGEIFRLMGLPEQGLEFLLRGEDMGKPPIASMVRNVPGIVRLLNRERVLPEEFERDCETIFDPALDLLESHSLTDLSVGELLERAEQIQDWLKPITYYSIVAPIGLAIRLALFRVSDESLSNDSSPEILSSRELQNLAADLRMAANGDFNSDRLDGLLTETPELSARFQTWLTTYGYLSEVGTDIAVPTWSDRPDTVKTLLFSLVRQAATEATGKTQIGWGKRWRAKRCEGRARVRDRIAEIYARLLAHLRWTFVELERRGRAEGIFAREGDIFFLKYPEVREWASRERPPETLAPLIAERHQQLEADRARVIPPVIYGNQMPVPRGVELEVATDLRGIPASAGCVEGVVKICHSLASYSAAPTDVPVILVVPYTDAGWAPLLASAGAIVAEVGGQLSHGAIVAREYGIPAVMNVSGATQKLQEGQRVRVDGALGTVEVLSDRPEVKV
ncbi:MAG: PEP/pyruvate-binding domain-containing protein [Cyanobacteria bacterium J06642_2]